MKNVYSVGQINSYIKNMFSQDFLLQNLSVKGEVSNCKYHSSGHIYFTLKDGKGAIACVMFAGSRGGLSFHLQEGQQIVVTGTVDIYERDGRYQLYAKQIKLDGTGALYEKIEQLKIRLNEQGMFDPQYKKQIPHYIKTLGVVTAPTGAAVRDIINIATRRNPYIQIILYPAIVQGDEAPASIIQGIHALEKAGVDLIIVGRGGGSIEDLMAFNEECVAEAVFDCAIPIISAVGHETDTTIIDYVSDLRAPTPSAAAELAVADVFETMSKINQMKSRINQLMKSKIELKRMILRNYQIRLQMNSLAGKIREQKTYLVSIEDHLTDAMNKKLRSRRHALELYIERLKGLSPLDKLNQGFSFVSDQRGKNVTDISQVEIGDSLDIYVKTGRLQAVVTGKEQ